MSIRTAKAIEAVLKRGALLVYPLANKRQPASLWHELFPRTKMRWEWDESGDSRVADLWRVRERLSRSRKVVYAKWFQGRATLFSPEVFVNLLAYFESSRVREVLSSDSRNIVELLESDSPLSTKQLKAAADMEGRLMEPAYNRAMKPLWNTLLIVGFGEFEDSSFPSLGLGATRTLFEELWRKAEKVPQNQAERYLGELWSEKDPFWKFAQRVRKQWIDLVLENPTDRYISDNSTGEF
jgi:hypothetical protein